MRETFLIKLANWHASHPWRMLALCLGLTFVFAGLASQLKVTMRWSDLLPSKDNRTIEFNRIIEEFVSATSLIVVVQGEEQRIKDYADALAPRILEAYDEAQNLSLFRRVDYKREVDLLKNHGLMLIKEQDLKNTKDIFLDPNLKGLLFNLNNALEKEYVGQEESISTREKEDQAFMFLDSIQGFVSLLEKCAQGVSPSDSEIRAVADKLLIGDPYFLSYDKQALILNAIPNFTMMDTHLLVVGTDAVQEILDDLSGEFSDVTAGLTGFIAVGRDEMVYAEQSLGYTTAIALVAILALLMLSFRMWVAPLLATANLLVGLVWAVGLNTLLVGQLNIMTQMMAVILLGLGIDFSIHLISGFTEWRAAGDSIAQALEKTFLKSGKGVITGALTTACAFFTLVISHSRGMKEMGIVTGSGLLAILAATLLFLPALLVFRERRLEKKQSQRGDGPGKVQRDITFRFLGNTAAWLGKHYVFTLICGVALTVIFVWSGLNIGFDHNYMNIEPKGLTSILLQDTILEKFDMGMDYALVLTDDVDSSREIAERYRDVGSVAMTEDISLYLPSGEQQRKRLPHLQDIAQAVGSRAVEAEVKEGDLSRIIAELERLEMNVMEMQDMAFLGGQDKVDAKAQEMVGDPEIEDSHRKIQSLYEGMRRSDADVLRADLSKFQKVFAPYFKEAVLQMSGASSLSLSDLPDSILDRYSNASRDQFLISVFPAGNVWQDAEYLRRFAGDLERVSDRATGMPPVFRALIEVIGKDGGNAMFLTLAVVFLLLLVDFRHPGYALMAMIPLAAGVFWMVGFMKLSGMQLTVMNVMGLPMILGIGIDDGVHIVHRLREEGKGSIRTVFSSTGKAVLLTSLTTMLAFGSLVFSIWRGFGHLGGALFLGVAACFLTTVLFLSGIIGFLERRRRA
jgi:predicted RND superfamily exporter protein